MAEYAGEAKEELASVFIATTCQLLGPSPSLLYVDHMHNLLPSTSPEPTEYSILCGSAAEFYIRPLITCIDDEDQLIVKTNELAFSGDVPVLPCDLSGFSGTIRCHKIEPLDRYPGFVRLRVWGEMRYNWKYKKYQYNNTAHTNTCSYAVLDLNSMVDSYSPVALNKMAMLHVNIVSGPAVKQSDEYTDSILISDIVKSMWCPQWPKEAQGWLHRPRNSGWPTTGIISEVWQNGCHLVYIQHRSCRNNKLQWRFSFSLAEIILIRSFTQTQQIVYHLLRFFAKSALIQKDCPKEDEVLCSYHLKTLVLWTCEEMSAEWWNSSSAIAICCELLRKLSEWLKRKYFPNYFITESNLYHEPSSYKLLDMTLTRLNEFHDSEILCYWFVENYIMPSIRTRFTFVGPMPTFEDCMLHLFEFWKMSQYKSFEYYFYRTFAYVYEKCRFTMKQGFHAGQRLGLKTTVTNRNFDVKGDIGLGNLPAIQNVSCFMYHDALLYILHIEYVLGCGEISWDSNLFVESVKAFSMQPKIIRSQFHNFPKTYTTKSCRFQFLRAQDLMENLTGSNSRPEFQLLSLMSKESLKEALKHDDSQIKGIASAALAYLAAFYFATSEYQQAMRFCLAVLRCQTSDEDKETLNASCLLYIDDVARIIGLWVIQKAITEEKPLYRKLYLDLRLSPEVFVIYLVVLYAYRISMQSELPYDLPDSSFPMDEYLKALIRSKSITSMKSSTRFNASRQIVYCRSCIAPTDNESSSVNRMSIKERLRDALMEYALDNMRIFYNVIHKDFGVSCNTADCYRALYLYKCRQYDQVLHSCERILKESDLQDNLKEFSFANVLVLPPLDSFFDGDVQSLLGFHTLFYYLYPLNDDMGQFELIVESTFEHWFARVVYCNKIGLVHILHKTYHIKCKYFLGRHFLAKYLKLRCCIDCNLPFEKALNEFAAHIAELPFEHIIQRFLLRKLRIKKIARVPVRQ